jgi:hypothetical protein
MDAIFDRVVRVFPNKYTILEKMGFQDGIWQ